MTQTLTSDGRLFTGEEPGFELPLSPGVAVHPLLTRDGGSTVDVFYLRLAPGSDVIPETHPYSETLIVIEGELSCSVSHAPGVVVWPGQIFHIPADAWHHVRNTRSETTRAAMLTGV